MTSYLPLDLSDVRVRPVRDRAHRVMAEQFARPPASGATFSDFIDALPHILKGNDLRTVLDEVAAAVQEGRPVILGLGAHVIKCGLAPVVVDLIRRGVVSAVAMNGGGAIHDVEIAMLGATSEDVEANLCDGSYGMVADTGRYFAAALERLDEATEPGRVGLGGALGRWLREANAPYGRLSVLQAAFDAQIPATVHVAIGTDTLHMLPIVDVARMGALSHRDFRLLAAVVARLEGGGAYLNVGSAVVLPEVFLKCVALCRNLGHRVGGFAAVDLDMIRQYRPATNVVARHAALDARGYALTGHHEIMLPLLAFALLDRLEGRRTVEEAAAVGGCLG